MKTIIDASNKKNTRLFHVATSCLTILLNIIVHHLIFQLTAIIPYFTTGFEKDPRKICQKQYHYNSIFCILQLLGFEQCWCDRQKVEYNRKSIFFNNKTKTH
jgi:hypothetical protein